jgi:hypothetical protein
MQNNSNSIKIVKKKKFIFKLKKKILSKNNSLSNLTDNQLNEIINEFKTIDNEIFSKNIVSDMIENIINNVITNSSNIIKWIDLKEISNFEVSNHNGEIKVRNKTTKYIHKINKDDAVSLMYNYERKVISIETLKSRYFTEDNKNWIDIDEMKNYEITNDNNNTHVRNKTTLNILQIVNGRVRLSNKENDRSVGIEFLKRKYYSAANNRTWITIEDFSNFEISNDIDNEPQIRNKTTKYILKINKHNSVLARHKYVRKTLRVGYLLRKYFPSKDLEGEYWKDIPGYEGLYCASNMGRIQNMINLNYLNPTPKENKYSSVRLFDMNSKAKPFRVHRLIAITFLNNPDNKPVVNHKNGNKNDNRLENLEWMTHQENSQHAYDTKLIKFYKRGVYQIDKDTNEIIEEFESAAEVERILDIAHQSISKVCKGKYKTAGGYKWLYINPERQGQTEKDMKTLPYEIWKNFGDTIYQVSSFGRIKNSLTGFILRSNLSEKNREYIHLGNITYSVHRLVALLFIPNPDNLPEVDHIDKNPTNNNILNLRWLTSKDNSRHSNAKAVEQYDLNNVLVNTWNSITEAAEYLDCDSVGISRCCKQKQYTCYEFKWKYKKDYELIRLLESLL